MTRSALLSAWALRMTQEEHLSAPFNHRGEQSDDCAGATTQ
jgi:hypothetical protein